MRRVVGPLIAGLAATAVLTACTSSPSPAPASTPLTDAERAALALTTLRQLSTALGPGKADEREALAAPDHPGSAAELDDLAANIDLLGLRDLRFRYVADTPELDPGTPDEWAVTAEVTWRRAGESLTVDLPVVLESTGSDATFVTARVPGTRETPLWALGRLHGVRARGVEVVSTDEAFLPRFRKLADQALVDLGHDLPPLRRTLVLEIPSSLDGFATLLGSDPHDVQKLAAITVTQFGAVHASILVNPTAFESLGPNAARIVISHEAVHVALDAPGSGMPMWLMEGYADFVALDAQDLPVRQSASQIIAQVRTKGLPDHLPGPADFRATTHGVGAAYESAWLACRWIADTYGKDRLLALYRAADRADDDRGPLRRVLGISRAELTAQWRAYLASLAGVGDV